MTDETPAERTMSFESYIPPVDESGSHRLSTQDRAAIDALQPDCALLIVHHGPNLGARFLLDVEVTTAGRSVDCDIFLDDVTVSREHARFERRTGGFAVVDSKSLNGTYVNRQSIAEHDLAEGDEVQIGKYRMTYYPAPQAS